MPVAETQMIANVIQSTGEADPQPVPRNFLEHPKILLLCPPQLFYFDNTSNCR